MAWKSFGPQISAIAILTNWTQFLSVDSITGVGYKYKVNTNRAREWIGRDDVTFDILICLQLSRTIFFLSLTFPCRDIKVLLVNASKNCQVEEKNVLSIRLFNTNSSFLQEQVFFIASKHLMTSYIWCNLRRSWAEQRAEETPAEEYIEFNRNMKKHNRITTHYVR